MSEKYERTFVVAVPVAKAWQAFADEKEREAWMGTRPPGLEESETRIVEVEPMRRFVLSDSPGGLEGWFETVVTFEEVSSGTRITIVRSGFGDSEDWRHFAENTQRGFDEMLTDLVLYLETGVSGNRHFQFASGLGVTMLDSAQGVRITHVVPGGFAAQAGMRDGDLLLRLNGAPVLSGTDVAFLGREHGPGTEIEAEYVRDGEVLRGRGALSQWNHGAGEFVGHPGGYPKPGLTGSRAR
jgi:uncharacterized protein YndB with AHSA1/START domain